MMRFFKVCIISLLLLCVALSSNAYARISTGFDFPVKPPDGLGYRNGRIPGGSDGWGFIEWNGSVWHPGEDWNRGAGETDFNDPLYAIGAGTVVVAKDFGSRWGNIVLIESEIGGEKIWAQYAHLNTIVVTRGQLVGRGEKVGTIGNAGGLWASHLHFEIRKKSVSANYWPTGATRTGVTELYYCPTDFINSHRPINPTEISLSQAEGNKLKVSWEAVGSSRFQSYNLYRATVSGGTQKADGRTLVFSSAESGVENFTDSIPEPGNYFYALEVVYNNGQAALSQEKSYEKKREIIQITQDIRSQSVPKIFGNKIFWQDGRLDPNGLTSQKLFYYDLESGEESYVFIGSLIDGLRGPSNPLGNANEVCYYLAGRQNTGMNIYCYSFEGKGYYPVIRDTGDQLIADLSDEGIVVWSDFSVSQKGLYYIDLRTSSGPQPIVLGASKQSPRIWSNKIIWRDGRRGGPNFDLYVKEIGQEEKLLVSDVGGIGYQDIWGDEVVWEERGAIKKINLRTGDIELVDQGECRNPRIRDGRIVYEKKTGAQEIYIHVYDIKTKKNTTIDFKLSFYCQPDIYEDKVVFAAITDGSLTNIDVFMTRVE